MKKIFLNLLFLTFFMYGNQNAFASTVNKKVLVAYYSLTGSTKRVAEIIAKNTNGELFEIVPVKPYSKEHDPTSERAKKEQDADIRPELSTHIKNMNNYDVIFIGFPIWWYKEPQLIKTFLEEYNFSGKIVIPFCTSGGVGIKNAEAEFRDMLPNSDIKNGGSFYRRTSEQEIKEWLKTIKL
ncbi:flavodoxin [Fusobacterium simiae]|uniref:Flavodoxin n=1 Tax=Fusobacterium simiae TaxID=855 RepID=A0ABT4DK23_FUSSI|nr:flavodoxin [Fusobacterium simiae]MCY7008955.1 flavodoxin [Fusobacterium simiae]